MVPLGFAALVILTRDNLARGMAPPYVLTFMNLMGITTFAAMMTASITSVTRHREWHRRFTYAAAVVHTQFACSRLFLPWIAMPYAAYAILLVPDMVFLGALAAHDRRALGRVHPATLWVAGIFLPLHVIATPIAYSKAWASIAPFVLHLTG